MRITEYVGKEGVISSRWDYTRAAKPRPGDHLRWNDGSLGRIEAVGEIFGYPEHIHVCRDQGSAFIGLITPDLSDDQQERIAACPERMRDSVRRAVELNASRVYLSISGGPFYTIPLKELKVTYNLAPSSVWNWGDNLAGADMGVDYTLTRPVFAIDRDRPKS